MEMRCVKYVTNLNMCILFRWKFNCKIWKRRLHFRSPAELKRKYRTENQVRKGEVKFFW